MTQRNLIKLIAAMTAVAVLSFGAGTMAQPRFGDVDRAEGSLQNALGLLQHARDIFGGHKANAEGMINQAMGELEQGKQFAMQHGY
jgi:hypothetical protein